MTPRDDASQRQVQAADPAASTWLSANAGSGKTRVLTDRVARLLLDGTDPAHILCLTYTKAAASEMQNRLFRRLGEWAMMDEARLSDALAGMGAPPGVDLARARTLFARAIETPGGLRIQTIHAFCASLLRRFPLEAGISPAFREMEDREAALLRLETADAIASGPAAGTLERLAEEIGGEGIEGLLAELSGHRDAFADAPGEAALRAALGLGDETAADLLAATLDAEARRVIDAWRPLVAASDKTTDQGTAAKLSGLHWPPRLADLARLETAFLTGKGAKEPFTAKTGKVPTKALRAAHPELAEDLDTLMQAVEVARPVRQRLAALDRALRLHAFARAFLPAYEAAKQARGLLDFDDLIGRARRLLTDTAVAQWVLWKLDGGIDHILVDEAQDTSPAQWQVIAALAQEMTAGEGAHADRPRTLFVVGDKKQSIYSFQGADPEAFDRMRDHFGAALAPTTGLNPQTLDHSFRSSAAILRVVDDTFTGELRDGLGDPQPHRAFKAGLPGRVDWWPAIPKPEKEEEDRHWTDPVDRPAPRHPDLILAETIAERLAGMVGRETIPVETAPGHYAAKTLSEGDVLILVRRRSALFSEIIRACKAKGLAVAGADRMKVGAELAVKDIAATLRHLALPEDDLSLAAALRSPLFGWTESELYRLAQGRGGQHLWPALRAARDAHPRTFAILDDLRDAADFLRPYDLIARLLLRHGGRHALLARLGTEAEEGIDALMAQALAYERAEIPSLTGFIEWMQAADLEVRRQLDAAGDRIRVMTVHGAKGLEAPLVILPDTAKRAADGRGEIYPGPPALWRTAADDMPPELAGRRDARLAAEERERRRLLYVAMTRAESWLIACAAGDTGTGGESWHAMIRQGMEAGPATALDTPTGEGLRVSHGEWDLPPRAAPEAPPAPEPVPEYDPAAPDPGPPPTVSPSDLGGAKVLPGDTDEGTQEEAMALGSAMHLLLERLPGIDPAARADRAGAILAALDPGFDAETRAMLAADALRLLAAPDLAEVFGPASLAEVPVSAAPPAFGGRRLHGAVDRLVVGEGRVRAVDFKTNRLVPDRPAAVPDGLLRQMAAYREMLREIWPGARIETAILWTATASLMPLPDEALDAALARVTLP